MNSEKKPFFAVVAEKLIAQLQKGTAPWQKPWEPGEAGATLPMNPTTGKRYKGINALQLMSEGRGDQRWVTYKQAAAMEAQVRKGERGTQIQYWKFSEEQQRIDSSGRPILNAKGQPMTFTVELERPRVFFATVFNAEQIDGMPAPAPKQKQLWTAIDRAEKILLASSASIRHGERDPAFYRPSSDSIHMPDKTGFSSADKYYAVALHELGHWTGHESRLARDLVHPFGSEGYAKEELRAEIASMILGDELGIGRDPGQHAAYVGSWIKVLQDDPLEIFRAAADAEKIQDYVLGLQQRQEQIEKAAAPITTSPEHPAAFVDTNGMLREWRTANPMAEDWQGVIKHEGAFWFVGEEAGVRTFTSLTATTLERANVEAERLQALAVDFGELLTNPDAPRDEFVTATGKRLDPAIRGSGLATLGAVTGSNPASFFEHAQYRLAGVIGADQSIESSAENQAFLKKLAKKFANKAEQLVSHLQPQTIGKLEETMGLYEQDNVSRAAAERAEAWTIAKLAQGGFARAADHATSRQLERMSQIISEMTPLTLQNPFWQRHQKPDDTALSDKIKVADELVKLRRSDASVAEARLEMLKGTAFGRQGRVEDANAFDQAAQSALGFTLPRTWIGRVRIEGNLAEEVDGKLVKASALASMPTQPWGVYALQTDGSEVWLADQPSMQSAEVLAERLSLIDAHSTINEFEKAAKLARIHEDRVRRDPVSTDEDIAAAKEARKDAEFAVTMNDDDLQRRIELEERERAQTYSVSLATGADESKAPRILINVPFKEKDEAKALGAKWDRKEQSWFVPAGMGALPFAKWSLEGQLTRSDESANVPLAQGLAEGPKPDEGRIYLAVPYGAREQARAAGAEWDIGAKSWYAGPKADMARLAQWKPENVHAQQEPAMSPQEEFAEALQSIGCVIGGDVPRHPIMDGKKHRISVEGEKFSKNSGSGFYVGHLDGHPAGYMKNNKTGAELTWKSKGYTLDQKHKVLLAAEAANKLKEREAQLAQLQERAAARVVRQMVKLVAIDQATPYLLAKGIAPHAGAYTDKEGVKTYLPAFDVSGKQWSMQYIAEDGTKRFAKDSRKEACFHVVGGSMNELKNAPAIVIGEGYATAAQLTQLLGFATVSAFDSGNLASVAVALHTEFPDKPIVIAADDDRHLELTQGVNPGRDKAIEAAALVSGKVLVPIFAPGENSYPANLDPVTPAKFRQHQQTGITLDDEQLAALERMKQFTDFNDLVMKSALGNDALDRQVYAAVKEIVAHQQASTAWECEDQPLKKDEPTIQIEKPKRGRSIKMA